MKNTFLVLIFLILSYTFSQAQSVVGQQFTNYNFENWRTEANSRVAPTGWNSMNTATGKFSSTAAKDFVAKISGSPSGSGSYVAQVKCVEINIYISKIPANGGLTTGRFNAGNISAAHADNCTYTSTENGYHQSITAYPDSVYVWTKSTISNNSHKARFNIVLHSNNSESVGIDKAIYRDPSNGSTNASKVIANATLNFNTGGAWKQQKVAFSYSSNTDAPAYMLATFSTNETAGTGTNGDILQFDDIILIYNTRLQSSIAFNGSSVTDFNPNSSVYNYTKPICSGNWPTITCQPQSAHASTIVTHNPTTAEPYTIIRVRHKNQESTVYRDYRFNFTNIVTPSVSISGNSTLCQGTSTTLTASGANTYKWDDNSTNANRNVSPVTTTTYTVTGTDANGCTATASHQITIKSLPSVGITGNNAVCNGSSVNLTASGADTYKWNDNSTNASKTVSPTVATTYTVTGTSNGCSATASHTVTINALPNVTISGTSAICEGGSTTLTAAGASTYAWDNQINSATNTVSPSSNTTYTVTGTDNNGCSNTASQTVTVKTLPSVAINGASEICFGSETTLTASGATSYAWTGLGNNASQNVSPESTTTYTVTGTANGCSATATHTVTINTLPNVTISGINAICNGKSATLTAAGATSYLWDNQMNTAANEVSPTTTTTYTVTGTDAKGCTNTASHTLTVNNLPNVTISGTSTICEGGSTSLTAAGANTYAWDNQINSVTNTVSPNSNTTYTVTGTDNNGCTNTASQTVTVKTLPSVSISGASELCFGSETTLTASGANSYAWSGLGISASQKVKPTTNTTYTVTGTTNGCSATATHTIAINQLPDVTISGTNAICKGKATTLTAAGATSYLWNNQINTDTTEVSPATTTTYSVIGTDAKGCTNTASHTLTVNTLPNVTISGTSTICEGGSTTLTALGATVYEWSNQVNKAANTVSPSSNTTYTVTGTDYRGCTNTASKTVTVKTLPSVSISGASEICFGSETTLTASGANSYAWSGLGISASQKVKPTTNTTYTVTGTTNGCSATATHTVAVNQLPDVTISGINAICNGKSTTLTAAGATSFLWNNQANTDTTEVSPTTTTTYSVTGTDAKGCTNTASHTLTVNTLPNVTISGASAICEGESTTLTADGANTYAWSNQISTATNEITPASTASYSVTGTDNNGCTNTASHTVTIKTLPSVSISGASEICFGSETTLTASGANTYAWTGLGNNAEQNVNPEIATTYTVTGTTNGCSATATHTVAVNQLPDVTISGINAICNGKSTTLTAAGATSFLWNNQANTDTTEVSPTTTTTYSVTGTDAKGCTNTASHTLTVNTLPNVTISGATAICDGETTTLTADGANTYAWSNQISTATNEITPTSTASYSVTGTDNNGCTNTASHTVTVKTLPSVSISGASEICFGSETTLTASGANTYAWTGLGNNAEQNVNPEIATTYTVTGTTNGCSATATHTVAVNQLPDVTISGINAICNGKSTTLTAAGATSFLWNNQANTDTTEVSPTTTTTYSVTGTDAKGCTNTASHTLTVNTLPNVTISGATAICDGETTTLTADGANTYAWSNQISTATNEITPASTTSYSVTGTDNNGCTNTASHTVTVKTLPSVSISGNNDICNGDQTVLTASGSDNYQWNTQEETASITVTPTQTQEYSVIGTTNGCSSTATYSVNVRQNVTNDFDTVSCDQYTWEGDTYQTSTNVTKHLTAANGCDSAVTMHLIINYSTKDTVDIAACDHYSWEGDTYFTDTTVTKTLTDQHNCDSVVTLRLTISDILYNTINHNVCDEYIWEGDTFRISGQYIKTLHAESGCDSVVTLNLNINHSMETYDTVSICKQYVWGGITYTNSGDFEHTFETIHHCDSLVHLHLTIKQPIYDTLDVVSCDSYSWNELTYTESGIYTQTLTASNNCDSIVTINLSINQSSSHDEYSIGCDSIVWEGDVYRISGEYTKTLTDHNSCDSTVTMHMTINKSKKFSFNQVTCDSITWEGDLYKQNGEYTKTLTSEDNCDSIVTMYLTVNHTIYTEFSDEACSSYTWNNETYTESGDKIQRFTAMNDCDSVVTLHLTIHKPVSETFSLSACDSLVWAGDVIKTSGTYTKTFTTIHNCDSAVTIKLTINHPYHVAFSATANHSYSWNNKVYGETGDYNQTFTAANGCDSVVTLHLTIYEGDFECGTTLQDIDENAYNTVKIGNLCWMAENLRSIHYSNGDKIPVALTYKSKLHPKQSENLALYGRLYDWYSAFNIPNSTPVMLTTTKSIANDSATVQGACPRGWRLPNYTDLQSLINHGDAHDLKSTDCWISSNGTDKMSITIRPGGFYNAAHNQFEDLGGRAYIHMAGTTPVENEKSSVTHITLSCNCPDILYQESSKNNAYSIRCVKEVVVLPNND